jgi:hypothetical protein
MAKLRPSVIKVQGSILDVTVVRGRRYGTHVRARRGTYTPVTLNDQMKQSKERLLSSNKPAKLIFDAVRSEHKDGGLWTDLLAVFRKQLKEDKGFSLKGLLKLECSRQYSLEKMLYNQFSVEVNAQRKKMQVAVHLQQHPEWDKKDYLDGYQLSIVVVFPDLKKDRCRKEILRAAVVSFKDELKPFHFEVPMPATTAPWILFLGVAGAQKGKVDDVPTTKGMAVVKVSVEE